MAPKTIVPVSEGTGEGSPKNIAISTTTTGTITIAKPTTAIFSNDILIITIYWRSDKHLLSRLEHLCHPDQQERSHMACCKGRPWKLSGYELEWIDRR